MIKAIYRHRFNKRREMGAAQRQVGQIITNLFGCQKQTPQFLIGSLQLCFVPVFGAEMDNLLPRQALFGKQLPSFLSFHLHTGTNAVLTPQQPRNSAPASRKVCRTGALTWLRLPCASLEVSEKSSPD